MQEEGGEGLFAASLVFPDDLEVGVVDREEQHLKKLQRSDLVEGAIASRRRHEFQLSDENVKIQEVFFINVRTDS